MLPLREGRVKIPSSSSATNPGYMPAFNALAGGDMTSSPLTINGVSLTVNRVADLPDGCEVSINLIPHTVENTALSALQTGARVNLEIDLIARYVERMLSLEKAGA